MASEIHPLLLKKGVSLEHQFYTALNSGHIKSAYVPFAPLSNGENLDEYRERIFAQGVDYQFVEVNDKFQKYYVAFGVSGPIISDFGRFELVSSTVIGGKWQTQFVLAYPDLATVTRNKRIFIRIDSGCNSGMLFGDKTCDCADQFRLAQKKCVKSKAGLIISVPAHDGRGWGEYKMMTQRIMHELKIDTVEAAKFLYGHEDVIDQRTYHESILILRALGFSNDQCFILGTNNPKKIIAFERFGLKICKQSSIVARGISDVAKKGLDAKSKKWGHDLHNGLLKKLSSENRRKFL